MAALKDKTWGYDELDAFLKNPKGAVPGTKMAFAGLSKMTERVNLIAYLRSLSDTPIAIPEPKPTAPAEPAAPAAPGDGTEPAGELQATPPGTAPVPGAPGTTTPGSAPPAAAPGTAAPANPTTTAPTTTPPPATPEPAKPAGGGH
jgi:cytochrome c